VIDSISEKMVRRHPHVFAEVDAATPDAVVANWEAIKADERAGKATDPSALADIANALPALLRAQKLQKRASRTGFDWDNVEDAIAKLDEEVGELREAVSDVDKVEEAGDLLFAAVNVCRLSGVDAESALKAANAKFERRFRAMETSAGTNFEKLDLAAKEALWQQVKASERA
jgi:ATP diphosphatase